MRNFTGCLAILLLTGVCPVAAAPRDPQPNVLFIVSDDQGYGEIGGQSRAPSPPPTPHLDRLAREGVRLTQAYANGHVCAPSRAAFLTGRYPHQVGFHGNGDADPGMPRTEKLLPAYFKAAGYATAAVGKWHLGFPSDRHPQEFGFDEFFGFLGGEHDYFDAARGHAGVGTRGSTGDAPILNGRLPVTTVKYLTEELTDRAIDFIRRHQRKPFCLYLAYNAVHSPMQAPPGYLARQNGNIRRAMLASLDDNIGRILALLGDLRIERNTILVFYGDNGGSAGADNGGLRGQKGTFFEGGIRVPAILRWPERLPAGQVYEGMVMGMDILPTVLAAARLTADRPLDGIDLLPLLTADEQPARRGLHWMLGANHAVRQGDWKFVRQDNADYLFNLRADIGEQANLATREPARLAELRALHQSWVKTLPPRQAGSERKNRKSAPQRPLNH